MSKQHLWAPWRIGYLQSLGGADAPGRPGACFLCEAGEAGQSEAQQAERLVLHRDDYGTLLLNRYPYTNGHLLAAPHEHVGDISDLSATQRAGLMELSELGTRALRKAMNPQGINIGMNLGRCAGAGVPGHLHWHVVPRWPGDVNFMPAIAGVRVLPQSLDALWEQLTQAAAEDTE